MRHDGVKGRVMPSEDGDIGEGVTPQIPGGGFPKEVDSGVAGAGRPARVFVEVHSGSIHPEGERAIGEFARHLQTLKRSPHTVKTYTLVVRDLLRGLPKSPEEITADDLAMYMQVLALERRYSKNSLYTAVQALVAFFRFIGSDAAENLSRPRRGMRTPRFITPDEVSRLMDAAAARGERDHLIVSILAYTGIRVSEICALRYTDLDAQNGTLLVRSGKGDRDRIVVLPEDLVGLIVARSRSAPGEYIFPGGDDGHLSTRTVQRVVRECAEAARIERKVTPHVLRHTFATTILRRGGDIRFIQQLLGHRSVATTQNDTTHGRGYATSR